MNIFWVWVLVTGAYDYNALGSVQPQYYYNASDCVRVQKSFVKMGGGYHPRAQCVQTRVLVPTYPNEVR